MAESLSILGVALAVAMGGVLLLWWQHFSAGRRGASKSGAGLPKGSLGWPLIGETLPHLRDVDTYVSSRVKRYGSVFKSSLFLKPTILGATPEFAKFFTSNEYNLFAHGYPPTVTEVLGPRSLSFETGQRHRSIRKIVQKHLLPESLRNKVGALEAIVLDHLASWEKGGRTVIGKKGAQKITMDVTTWLLLGLRDMGGTSELKEVIENLDCLNEAMFSSPVNLPGFAYHKGLKAKAVLTVYLKQLLDKRRGQGNSQEDMVGDLIAAQEDPKVREELRDFDDDLMADNLLFFWFAANETTSSTLTWVLKLLKDHPDILRRIQAEQQEILQSKDPSAEGSSLSWDDTRKMVYTQKFFQELLRIISIIPAIPRKAKQDVEYDGHLIPKDWAVFYTINYIHSNPEFYPDPDSFNPDRFDTPPKPYTYLPFSAGPHMCAGMDLAKLITLIFIHHITTTYTYERVGPDMGSTPYKGAEPFKLIKVPKGGYPIKLSRRN